MKTTSPNYFEYRRLAQEICQAVYTLRFCSDQAERERLQDRMDECAEEMDALEQLDEEAENSAQVPPTVHTAAGQQFIMADVFSQAPATRGTQLALL